MKQIYLIRHAKSDWSDPASIDKDRGLNTRGKRDILLMGEALKEREITPEIILSSSAKRTRLTIQGLQDILCFQSPILYSDALYLASPDTIASIIQDIDNRYSSVFIIGHNPGLTDFANSAGDKTIENIPTLGMVALECFVPTWQECCMPNKAKTTFFIYPKMFL